MYNAWLTPCVSYHNTWYMRLMKRGEIAQWFQRCSRNTHDGPLCCVSKACIYKSVKYSVLRERATLSLRGVPHTMRLRFISQFESLKQTFKKERCPSLRDNTCSFSCHFHANNRKLCSGRGKKYFIMNTPFSDCK